jgi:acyl-coenzyme A thioesterase PaaI-like protein
MSMNPEQEVLRQVHRAIALNRTPGYHFCGNFVDLEMYHDAVGDSRVVLHTHRGITDENNCISPLAMAVMADFAFASAVRSACDDPAARLATVTLNLSFTGRAADSDVLSNGQLLSFFENGKGKLGLSRAEIHSDNGLVAFGTSSFMVLPTPPGQTLHPIAWVNAPVKQIQAIPHASLTEHERWIWNKAQAALASENTGHFLQRFFDLQTETTASGAQATFSNGPHMSNRVGHVQGGITLGAAIMTADAAMGLGWAISGLHANFVRPAVGQSFSVQAVREHRGSLTAVLRISVLNETGDLCLLTQATYARCKQEG